MNESPNVYVIDDDSQVRVSLQRLIRSVGLRVTTFASAAEFLSFVRTDSPACLVLDVRLPGLSGLDLQHELAEAKIQIPIIFITGHGDVPMSVKAMKAGAFEFLIKPFQEQELLDAIQKAIELDRQQRRQSHEIAELRRRYDTLTRREQEVLARVVKGMLNKQIAAELDVTEKTIKFHRAFVMQKMQANSLADLVRMAGKLRI